MTGPHREHTARPAQLGFQSFRLGCGGEENWGPCLPTAGEQALPAAPSQAPSHRHVVTRGFLMLLAFILPLHRLECQAQKACTAGLRDKQLSSRSFCVLTR